MSEPDPFDTAGLRAAVLASWADSPTRFREDANAEEDLLLGGYADRWLVELAQNAADAARRAGRPGRLLVRVQAGPEGDELRVANTGAALDGAGVAALASLRASTKRDADTVGRFGVGFAAVLGVSDEPRILSGTGGVRFSAERTRAEVAALAGAAPDELARRAGRPPVLRLPWPVADEPPPAGYHTDVRLPLLPAVDAAALLDAGDAAAPDLLLALPWLVEITVVGRDGRRTDHRRVDHCVDHRGTAAVDTLTLEPGGRRWRLVRRTGTLSGPRAAEDPPGWSVCWALPLAGGAGGAGRPDPLTEDVLHAPTPSDERLGLPARLFASLPMQPSRRRVRPGPAVDEVVAAAADTYLELVRAVPGEHRAVLAPAPGFPLGELDAALRSAVSRVLAGARWLPSARGAGEADTLAPDRARLLDLPGAPELAGLVADAVPELLADTVRTAPRAALTALGVRPLGLAELADRLTAVRWSPARWRVLYAALAAAVEGLPDARDELGALPVPLVDGRTVTGPRGVLVLDGEPGWAAEVTGQLAQLDLPGPRIVHPDAAHPLLIALGATVAGPAGLLDHPGVAAAVDRSVQDAEEGGSDTAGAGLVRLVLGLVAQLGADRSEGGRRPWLAALALPDTDGEPRRADELMLPDAVIRPLLTPDGPLGVLHPELVAAHPQAVLTAVGVLGRFAVLVDEQPVGPDHDLDDEERWWDGRDEPPSRLVAVRDLDLVDEAAWPAALAQLAADPRCRPALFAAPGAEPTYTAWWLARHARLGGHRPGHWRLASATGLAGLFDPPPTEIDIEPLGEDLLAAIGVRSDLTVRDRGDAAALLARLADPARRPDAALTHTAHAALADAIVAGRLDPGELDPPARLRSIAGSVVDAEVAALLDRPWLAPVMPPQESVSGLLGDPDRVAALADLLDLPLASELVSGARIVGADAGRPVRWTELAEVVSACAVIGTAVPRGRLWLHDQLTVELPRRGGADRPARLAVPTWLDDDGRWHAGDPLRALFALLGSV